MRWLRRVAVVVGMGLLLWAVSAVGWDALWRELRRVGWWIVPILLFYGVIFGLDTWGWGYAFPARRAPWQALFFARMAGEAVNYVTPTAWVGGEPVKAYLLKRSHGVSMIDGISSVVIAKTALTVGLWLFAVCGVALAWRHASSATMLMRVSGSVLVGLGVLVVLFIVAQRWGLFRRLAPLAQRLLGARADGVPGHAVDAAIRHFYRSQRGRLALSVAFHFLGWVAGAGEVWLILYGLGFPVTPLQAWMIESLWQLLKSATFVIPAGIGTQEGGIVLIFMGLGFSLPVGLAMAVVRRLREFVWTAAGLLVWSRYETAWGRG
ncbi:MAG: flippase-like domain-containing protein [Candidatus Omnitrophica bacterium]|nr:flippase-like domain-containing protein [Candidatus Omnitrophota bacterium]